MAMAMAVMVMAMAYMEYDVFIFILFTYFRRTYEYALEIAHGLLFADLVV